MTQQCKPKKRLANIKNMVSNTLALPKRRLGKSPTKSPRSSPTPSPPASPLAKRALPDVPAPPSPASSASELVIYVDVDSYDPSDDELDTASNTSSSHMEDLYSVVGQPRLKREGSNTSNKSDYDSEWYHGELSRKEAEDVLISDARERLQKEREGKGASNLSGLFLIRKKEGRGNFAVSMLIDNGQFVVHHLLVQPSVRSDPGTLPDFTFNDIPLPGCNTLKKAVDVLLNDKDMWVRLNQGSEEPFTQIRDVAKRVTRSG
eukprot:m.333223 g.333223  ORF g.333223 m.333223 type:complete len:261 (+) comp17101_c0_seq1:152-934(+)